MGVSERFKGQFIHGVPLIKWNWTPDPQFQSIGLLDEAMYDDDDDDDVNELGNDMLCMERNPEEFQHNLPGFSNPSVISYTVSSSRDGRQARRNREGCMGYFS